MNKKLISSVLTTAVGIAILLFGMISCDSCKCKNCPAPNACKDCCCVDGDSTKVCSDTSCPCTKVEKKLPLNISIFLDLSDRLAQTDDVYSQEVLDSAIISNITLWFAKNTRGPGILQSQNRIKVFFHPDPKDPAVLNYAKNLDYDITQYEGIEKTKTLTQLDSTFWANLKPLYEGAISEQKWIGSDVWGFFSYADVDNSCIRSGFRNVIFIITDGYLYYAPNSAIPNANLTPSSLSNPQFRLEVKRDGLDDLEVCMLEVRPESVTQREPLLQVLSTWFTTMGIKPENLKIATTSKPNNTAVIIENFLNK